MSLVCQLCFGCLPQAGWAMRANGGKKGTRKEKRAGKFCRKLDGCGLRKASHETVANGTLQAPPGIKFCSHRALEWVSADSTSRERSVCYFIQLSGQRFEGWGTPKQTATKRNVLSKAAEAPKHARNPDNVSLPIAHSHTLSICRTPTRHPAWPFQLLGW